MDRRQALLGLTSVISGSIAGCLSRPLTEDDESAQLFPENYDVKAVAAQPFEDSLTPICTTDESITGDVEGENAEFVTAHEFFQGEDSNRYGVRGRIKSGDRGGVPGIHVSFSDGSSVYKSVYRLNSSESYLFTMTTAEGDSDEVSEYTITVRDGGDADSFGSVPEDYASIDGSWGQIGEYNDEPVYGYAASVKNKHNREIDLVPHIKAYIDESTVAHETTAIDSLAGLSPKETQTVYFPYPRCDPGDVVEVKAWLEWDTQKFP